MAAAALWACSALVLATPPGAFDPRSSTGYSLSAAAAKLDEIFKVSKDKALPHPGEVPPTPGKVCGRFWTCCSCQKLIHGGQQADMRRKAKEKTRPAARKALKCADMVGRDTGKALASSPALLGPDFSIRRTSRRVGSDRALKTSLMTRHLANHQIVVNRAGHENAPEPVRGESYQA